MRAKMTSLGLRARFVDQSNLVYNRWLAVGKGDESEDNGKGSGFVDPQKKRN